MVQALGALEPRSYGTLAMNFAEQTSDTLGWSGTDFLPIVEQLAALARRAQTTGKSMFFWNSL